VLLASLTAAAMESESFSDDEKLKIVLESYRSAAVAGYLLCQNQIDDDTATKKGINLDDRLKGLDL